MVEHQLQISVIDQPVFEMIKHQREVYSWEFIFLGADQDAIAEGGK